MLIGIYWANFSPNFDFLMIGQNGGISLLLAGPHADMRANAQPKQNPDSALSLCGQKGTPHWGCSIFWLLQRSVVVSCTHLARKVAHFE